MKRTGKYKYLTFQVIEFMYFRLSLFQGVSIRRSKRLSYHNKRSNSAVHIERKDKQFVCFYSEENSRKFYR
jgi:hypothetical protein